MSTVIKYKISSLLFPALFSAFSACTAYAQEAGPEETEYSRFKLPWTSNNTHPDDVARQVQELYISLFNSENLPVREYFADGAETLSQLAYDLEFFLGNYFPEGMDALLCDLNPHVCSRQKILFEGDPEESPTQHIGGYQITRGNWKYRPGVKVNVIDLELLDSTQFAARVIPEGYSIADVLDRETPDCSEFQTSCAELVRMLNPDLQGLYESSDGFMTAILPTHEISTYIPLKDSRVVRILGEEYQLVEDSEGNREGENYTFTGAADFREAASTTSPTWALETQRAHLYTRPEGPGRLESVFDNLIPESAELFEFTNHPFSAQEGNVADLVHETINIGVIDSWIDINHCHFAGKIELIRPIQDRNISRSSTCYSKSSAGTTASHGTHVTGSITGGEDQAKFMGLFPQSKIYFSDVDIDNLGVNVAENEKVRSDLQAMALGKDVLVLNASWDYLTLGNNDPIYKALNAFKNLLLVVASAGNYARTLSLDDRGCIWDPACLSNSVNLISVVALTSDKDAPEIYELGNVEASGSNNGTAFHIAAIGENVYSTLNGDEVGPLSGTSQAAPQVTAAAGLLYAVFKQNHVDEILPKPSKVKNRLMYSADIFPDLLDKVYSGRLNISRAIAIDSAYVSFRNDPDNSFRSLVLTHPPYIECRVGNEVSQVPWSNVRRMVENKLSNTMVVFYVEPSEGSPGNFDLKRIPNCILGTRTNTFSVEVLDTGQVVELQMKDISDFISRM